jgi:endonuclease YncB( thermonuclease family)
VSARLPVFLALLFLLQIKNAYGSDIIGRIVSISDGDTVKLLDADNNLVKIRLAEIDAPEKKQPYGMKAKQELSSLCFNRNARAVVKAHDKYRRTVARLYCDGQDVDRIMLERGAVWVYRQYLTDQSLLEVEMRARAAHVGLWSLQPDQITPPWDWRKAHKHSH